MMCVALAGLAFFVFAARAWGIDRYTIQVDGSNPFAARIELQFDSPLNKATPLHVRGDPQRLYLDHVRCLSDPNLRREGNTWIVPAGCQIVAWDVQLRQITGNDYDMSRQEPFFHQEGWWFLGEFGSLLRRAGTLSGEVCSTNNGEDFCRRLPPMNRAPVFVLGGSPLFEVHSSSGTVSVFADEPVQGKDLGMLASIFEQQMSYLERTFRELGQQRTSTTLQIAWIGINREEGVMGGAAGDNAFLANYVLVDGAIPDTELSRLLIVSAHEYAHVLGLNVIGAPWATESLATYYGFKSLEKAGRKAGGLVDQMLVPQPFNNLWREIDEAILQATKFEESLDDYIELLVYPNVLSAGGELPEGFVEAVSSVVGEAELNAVIRRNTGRGRSK